MEILRFENEVVNMCSIAGVRSYDFIRISLMEHLVEFLICLGGGVEFFGY